MSKEKTVRAVVARSTFDTDGDLFTLRVRLSDGRLSGEALKRALALALDAGDEVVITKVPK